MSKSNHNIDETFRDAFRNWEADYSMQEMNADWDAFSKNIPQAPQNPVVKSPLKNPWSAGKILGLSSVAGVIITAATLVLYNNSNDDNKLSQKSLETNNLPKTEQITEEKTINTGSETIISADLKENTEAESVIALKDNRKIQNSRSETKTSQKVTVKEDILLFDNNIFTNQPQQPKQPVENNKADVVKQQNSITRLNDTGICLSKAIHIYNSINGKNTEMQIEWGDGKSVITSRQIASHNYEKAGVYTLKMVHGNETIQREVIVKTAPKARFTNNQSNGLTCKFKNLSEGAYGHTWFFGDNSQPLTSFNAEHTFPDTGRYLVKLVAFSPSGCRDTLAQWVNVSSRNKFDIPNVITPNNDGSNDAFEIRIEGAEHFEVIIWNRANQTVFQTTDKNNLWRGNNQNGEPCQAGTYYYYIKYQLPGENANHLSGNVTLIR